MHRTQERGIRHLRGGGEREDYAEAEGGGRNEGVHANRVRLCACGIKEGLGRRGSQGGGQGQSGCR